MRIFIPVIFFSVFAVGCVHIKSDAQSRDSNSGRVGVTNSKYPTPDRKRNTLEMTAVDFKNFSFPDFVNTNEKTFTLRKGVAESKNAMPKYILRKTYYFDLTGDDEDEAVTHIIAEGCQMGCDSSNLFYIHTADGNQPKLLWKIAIGGNPLGGLKAVNFKTNEIVVEVFGDCGIDNGIIKPQVDVKKNPRLKTSSYTRFAFSGGENGFSQTGKDIIPMTSNIDLSEYRVPISFGEQL
jgi:hypothetical protein